MVQYKYLYEGDSGKYIVTSIHQLSDLCGLSNRQISYAFKKSNVYYDRYGNFKIERIKYIKDESKKRSRY